MAVNKMSVVTKDSNGTTVAFPGVCKTPSPGGPVPIPYPNVARSSDTAKGTKKVTVGGNPVCVKDSNFSTSTGDEAGTAGGGVASGCARRGGSRRVLASLTARQVVRSILEHLGLPWQPPRGGTRQQHSYPAGSWAAPRQRASISPIVRGPVGTRGGGDGHGDAAGRLRGAR